MRHLGFEVSEVMEGRFLTRKLARVVAFNAAHTLRRCRPLGAVTNSRAQPPIRPQNGAQTPWAASSKKTTR